MIEQIEELGFDKAISEGLAVVDFTASWCPDCRFIEPMLEALDSEFGDKIRFYKVSFDNAQTLKDTLNIRRIPTLIFYKDGQEVLERLIEPRNLEMIKDSLNALLAL